MFPLVIAHRGASAEAPENTLRAFARALALGVDGIELDVQVTRDGVAVVFHDSSLMRLTGTRGRIADRTWAELQKLRVGGEPIPTLADALALTRKQAILQIEIKKGVPVAPVLAAIRRTASSGQVILASFESDILRQVAVLAPKLPRMLIANLGQASRPLNTLLRQGFGGHGTKAAKGAKVDPSAMKLLQTMAAVGASGISVCHEAITTPLFVETIHRRGAQLWCWTVNDVSNMRRLRDYAVDAILTNDPAKLLKVLRT
jgi:glycerophosphoryl diester phosphodiesterase